MNYHKLKIRLNNIGRFLLLTFLIIVFTQSCSDSKKDKQDETKIELLESTISNGVIAKYIEKKGEGIHHIAFEVKDIKSEMKRLQNNRKTLPRKKRNNSSKSSRRK